MDFSFCIKYQEIQNSFCKSERTAAAQRCDNFFLWPHTPQHTTVTCYLRSAGLYLSNQQSLKHNCILCVYTCSSQGYEVLAGGKQTSFQKAHQDQIKHSSTLTQQLNIKNLFQENTHRSVQRQRQTTYKTGKSEHRYLTVVSATVLGTQHPFPLKIIRFCSGILPIYPSTYSQIAFP